MRQPTGRVACRYQAGTQLAAIVCASGKIALAATSGTLPGLPRESRRRVSDSSPSPTVRYEKYASGTNTT